MAVNSGYNVIDGISSGINADYVDTWLEWQVLHQDPDAMTSQVEVYLYAKCNKASSTAWDVPEQFGYVGVAGADRQHYTTAYDFSGYRVNCFGYGQFTLSHNSDGSCVVSLEGAWSTSHSSYISGGSVSAEVTLPAISLPEPEYLPPVVELSVAPADTPLAGFYIQGNSRVQGTVTATDPQGLPMEITMTVAGLSYAEPYLSGVLLTAGELTVTATATNTAGLSGTAVQTVTVLPYTPPAVRSATAFRCDSTGTAADGGGYLVLSAKVVHCPLVVEGLPKNSCSLFYRYMQEGTVAYGDWQPLQACSSREENVISQPLAGSLQKDKNYLVQMSAQDSLGNTARTTFVLPGEGVYMHQKAGGKALGLGGYASGDDLLDVYWNARLRKKLTVDENIYAQSMNNVCIRQWEILGGDSLRLTVQPGERGQGSVFL